MFSVVIFASDEHFESEGFNEQISFNFDTGTLFIYLYDFQLTDNLINYTGNDFVSYDNRILTITPYYQETPIKRVELIGSLGTMGQNAQNVDAMITDISVKLSDGIYSSDFSILFNNIVACASNGNSFLDLSNIPNVIVEYTGKIKVTSKNSHQTY